MKNKEDVKMSNLNVPNTIYQQLGGNRFVAMTGAKYFVGDKNSLRFKIGRNKSKTNTVEITLRGDDTYDMTFKRVTMPRISLKTGKNIEGKNETIQEFHGVFFDQLQELFTEVTGLYTHL